MPVLVKYPTVVTTQSVAPESNNDWSNPGNVVADDGSNASITAASFDSPDISYRLKAAGFDFSAIPDDKIVHGIIVEIERYCDAGETGADYRVQLLDADGNLVGDNKAKAGNWPTAIATQSYGGTEDQWGTTLTPTMVKSASFGLVLSVQATSANADIYVDYIRISVYYGSIDIGPGATVRGTLLNPGAATYIQTENPANASGTIDTMEFYYNFVAGAGVKCGTFYGGAGTFTNRDFETIGSVTAGSKQTFSGLDCDVQTDDLLGHYQTGGLIYEDTSGYSGVWQKAGDQFGAGEQTGYTTIAYPDEAWSIYGTGTESGGWVNIAKVNGVLSAAMASVNGVAVAGVAKLNGVTV